MIPPSPTVKEVKAPLAAAPGHRLTLTALATSGAGCRGAGMKDFFISYNAADKAWAEWIAWQLEASGWSVIVQAWDFRPGGNFALDMNNALTSTQRTIAVLSPSFLTSDYTAPEWAATFARDPTGAARRLIPVRVRECRPTGLLAPIVCIDLVGIATRDEARKVLIDGLRERVKPSEEPALPEPDPVKPRVAAEEPPWPPALEIAARVARGVLVRVARIGAAFLGAALITWLLLGSLLPGYVQENPLAAGAVALLWGAITALVLEAAVFLKRRFAPSSRSFGS